VSAMPRKRRRAVKMSPVARGHFRTNAVQQVLERREQLFPYNSRRDSFR
jgi:hypothetical protein